MSLQATAPSTHWPNATNSISVVIVTKHTIRSPTARFSRNTLTRLWRNSARLAIMTMSDTLPSNVDTLPSNVSTISTEMVETRKTIAGVQIVSNPSADGMESDVVGGRPASLVFSVPVQDRIVIVSRNAASSRYSLKTVVSLFDVSVLVLEPSVLSQSYSFHSPIEVVWKQKGTNKSLQQCVFWELWLRQCECVGS